jgi:hypothetical protein
LTESIAYARSELHLEEIEGTAPGLIMGRRGDSVDKRRLRHILSENKIEIHSYDWLIECLQLRAQTFALDDHFKRPNRAMLKWCYFRKDPIA